MPVLNGERLPYGQDDLVPAAAPGAWGARLIVSQDGYVDVVGDRMGAAGDRRVLSELTDRFDLNALRNKVGELLRSHRMQTRTSEDFTVFEDDVLEIHANTNASAGYCYVTGWLKP